MSFILLFLALVFGFALYTCHLITTELARVFPRWAPLWWLRYAPYVAFFSYLWWAASGGLF